MLQTLKKSNKNNNTALTKQKSPEKSQDFLFYSKLQIFKFQTITKSTL